MNTPTNNSDNVVPATEVFQTLNLKTMNVESTNDQPSVSISLKATTRRHSLSEDISSMACTEAFDQTERLKNIVREFRSLFKSWRQQVAALSSQPRFPNLTRLLANHFKEELPASLKSTATTKLEDVTVSGKKNQNRRQRLGKGFQKRAPIDNSIPGETRKDK